MSDVDWTVLVPAEVLEGESVPDALIGLLSTLRVVLLGYHVLPEQTAPGQARIQFGERAQTMLDDLAVSFREAGGECDTRLVFTHDEEQTLNRVADETGCESILIPNPAPRIDRVLVLLRDEEDATRLAEFVAALIGDRGVEITLYRVVETEEGVEAGRSVVETARERLLDRGIENGAISKEVEVSETPVRTITDAATDHDTVVMKENESSLQTAFFGNHTEQVAAQSLRPVIVVRRANETDEVTIT